MTKLKNTVFALILFIFVLFNSFLISANYADTIISNNDLPEVNLSKEEKESLLSALYEADIPTVREALLLKLITSKELTEYYLERINEYNKEYNCFITFCDNAIEEAEKRDALIESGESDLLLLGIPIVVKDNINYEGYHTTNGYKKKNSQIAVSNAAIVDNLLKQGAVILGKTNMSTGAKDAKRSKSEEAGETQNAYSPLLVSGGSSGGSAVSTSLNFALAGIGTDTNSSLRYPAALNGCVSLRPTYGLFQKSGIFTLDARRDVPGAITRSVEDQAIMLDALSGSTNYAENLNANVLSGMRIGILKQLSEPLSGVSERSEKKIDKEVLAAFDNAVNELRLCGAEVIEVSMTNFFSLSNACYKNSASKRNEFYKVFKNFLTENNILAVIYPTYLHTPQFTGYDSSGQPLVNSQIYINNCSYLSPPIGIPEISVPIGVHSRGAGIGMEIAADKNQEQLLLDIAYSYTEKYDHRVLPNGAPDSYNSANKGTLAELIEEYKDSLTEKETETSTPNTETQITITESTYETTRDTSFVTEPPETPNITEEKRITPELTTQIKSNEMNERGSGLIYAVVVLALLLLVAIAGLTVIFYKNKNTNHK